ncbi:MAG TPA: thioredoxin domain-containing protein [Kofleriaceae bacterium]|nr:thioredoxin domain-containing protein [Kofleriaceae bacterium]
MNHVTRLALAAVIGLAAVGCEHSQSGPAPVSARAAAPAGVAAATPASRLDRSGTVEERLARLEEAYNKNAEALDFLSKVYAQQKAQQEAAERDEPAPDAMFAVAIADDVKAGQVDGPASAPVTIVKAFDFACPYCQRMSGTMEELVKEYKGKVRVVYTNLLVHPPAKPAHLASCAAARQGKYNEFKHAFWDKGFLPYAQTRDESKLGEANILAIAKDLGLDTARLKTDMASAECEARIQRDMAELSRFHVNATPTFFINGKFIGGALPKEELERIIDEQLKIAEASGVAGADYYDKVVLAKGERQFRSKLDPRPK